MYMLFFGETIRLGQTMLMYLGEFTDAVSFREPTGRSVGS